METVHQAVETLHHTMETVQAMKSFHMQGLFFKKCSLLKNQYITEKRGNDEMIRLSKYLRLLKKEIAFDADDLKILENS